MKEIIPPVEREKTLGEKRVKVETIAKRTNSILHNNNHNNSARILTTNKTKRNQLTIDT